jgi:hypothetical protein
VFIDIHTLNLRKGNRIAMSRKHLYAQQSSHMPRNSTLAAAREIPQNAVDPAVPTSYAPSTATHQRVPSGVSIPRHNPETLRARIY